MKTNKNQLKEVSQILELEDNKVLIELYGQHDENLTKIENNFGIHISYRGNIIEFRGNEDSCSSASKLISSVYKKLVNGKKINEDIFDDISTFEPSVTVVESILALASWYEILTVDELALKL